MGRTKFVRTTIRGTVLVAAAQRDLLALRKVFLWLSRHDANALKKIRRYVAVIAVRPVKSYDNEYFEQSRVWVMERGTLHTSSTVYLASLIVHEAHHGAQFARGLTSRNFSLEPAAYRAQIRFLRKHHDEHSATYVTELLRRKHWETNFIQYRQGRPQSSSALASYASAAKKFLAIQMGLRTDDPKENAFYCSHPVTQNPEQGS